MTPVNYLCIFLGCYGISFVLNLIALIRDLEPIPKAIDWNGIAKLTCCMYIGVMVVMSVSHLWTGAFS